MYKVLIRPLEINDAKVSWKWRNNPKIWELTGSKPSKEITYDIEKEWIKKVINDENAKRFAILVDDKYIGNVQLTNIKDKDSAEYHIFIGDVDYWNKGIAKLASLQLIRFAKEVLGLKKIFLYVKPEHTAAIKLYKSCNFIIVSDEIKMELDLENSTLPMVSVFVMVYNHERFITDAIDSFLMQKCNFDFEIVIGEDCSIDNSKKLLLDYQNKFPGKFKLLLHKNNIGAQNNQNEVFKNCTGKYIAMCEGDDYWTDPNKLQKQVDFLEQNPLFSLVGHQAILKNEIKLHKKDFVIGTFEKDIFEYSDIVKKNIRIPTASIVFRNKIVFPEWFLKVYGGDRALIFLASKLGKIKIMDFKGSVYRIQSSGMEQRYKKDKTLLPIRNIQEQKIYLEVVEKENKQYYCKSIAWNYFYLSIVYLKSLKLYISLKCFLSSVYYKNLHFLYSIICLPKKVNIF